MASLSKDKAGNRTIQFVATDGKRRSIRLGSMSAKHAEQFKQRVEVLVMSVSSKFSIDGETAKWIGEIDDVWAAKLAAVGLISERPKSVTLAGLLAIYGEEKEAGNRPGTRTNHRTITNDLTRFFNPNIDAKSLTEADAKAFLEHLRKRELASCTVARRVRRVKSIFAFGVKKKFLTIDPFTNVMAMATLPEDRKAYVSVEDAEKLLAAASPVWRTIIALCRFAGLRCPSEVFRLTWADVNFATNRMTISNVKTSGHSGKLYRPCSLFASLRPHLEDAHELAEPGTVYVVNGPMGDRIRAKMDGPNGSNDANTRTEFLKLIKRAGLVPWPRLFHTLRASCETDLLETLPMSAVTEWLGHSAAVALKHYTRVPEHVYERAAQGGAKSGAVVVQNPVQTEAAGNSLEMTNATGSLEIKASRRVPVDAGSSSFEPAMTPRRFELRSQP